MTNGWIKLHRSILEWEHWNDRNTRDLFIYCLLAANHNEQRLSGLTIPRGTFLASRQQLAAATGISQQSVRTSLARLVQSANITIEATSRYTLVTVCNYNCYQSTDTTSQPTANQVINQPSTSHPTNCQPSDPLFSTNSSTIQPTKRQNPTTDTHTDICTNHETQCQPSGQPANQPADTDFLTKNQPSPSHEINQPINHKQEYIKKEEYKEERKEDYSSSLSLSRAREEALALDGVIGDIKKIADEVRQEILNNGSIVDSLHRLYGLSPQQQQEYLGWFVDKLTVDGTQFKSRSDFRMHFNNWLRKQIQDKRNQQYNTNGNNNGSYKHHAGISDKFLADIAADIASGH